MAEGKMVPMKTKVLGTLKYDKELDWWSGHVTIGRAHKVEVHVNNIDSLEKAMPDIEKRFTELMGREAEARAFAARKLLKLANEWSEGETVTKEDFVSRMTLESVEFLNDLSMGLYYDDGDLFWGHTITVDIDKTGKFTRAEFQG